jgi:hypothetical protein
MVRASTPQSRHPMVREQRILNRRSRNNPQRRRGRGGRRGACISRDGGGRSPRVHFPEPFRNNADVTAESDSVQTAHSKGTFTVRRIARRQYANPSDLCTLVAVAQGVDHALQDPERARLFVLRHAAQHPDLDGSDRNGRLLEAPPTACREPRGKHFPDRGLRGPGHGAASFQGVQQHVHRLSCHERSSRELGVRQARALGQQLEAGVVRHGHPERPQHCLHGRAKRARGLLQQVAH